MRLKATAKELIHRNTPKLYARYMRANPLYFEGLFHVRFTERNLERALETMFSGRRKAMRKSAGQRESLPGTEPRRAARGHVKGTCANCRRGPFYLNNDLCRTCERAAGSFVGQYRDEALAEIRTKIQGGKIMPRGKNCTARPRTSCENCGRENVALNGRNCTTCSKAAAGLAGEERAAALAAIREKIQSRSLKLWGKHRGPKVEEKPAECPESGAAAAEFLQARTGKVETPLDRLRPLLNEIEDLGYNVQVTITVKGLAYS